jgi:hypothetical protein
MRGLRGTWSRCHPQRGVQVPDPLGFPVLAGSAITQAFGFLYGRLAALLDRHTAADKAVLDYELPLGLVGHLAPLEVDQYALARLRAMLESLDDALGVYKNNPKLLDAEDERLRRNLGRLRSALEAVYHQRFTFEGEQRPPTAIKVEQWVDEVAGEVTGLTADDIAHGARGEVKQVSKKITKDGRVIGARIRRVDDS